MATQYAIALTGPHVIEIGVTSSIEALVYSGASAVTPTSGTVSVFDESGTAIVDAQSTTGTYSVADSVTAALSGSSRYRALWSLTLSGGTVLRAPNRVILTKYILRNPVSNATLLAQQPTWNAYPAGKTSWQDQLDAVWADTLNRLLDEGRNPHEIRNPYGLVPYVRCATLAVVAATRATYVDDLQGMADKQAAYEKCAEAAWANLRLDRDTDGDGDVDEEGQPAETVLFLSATPPYCYDLTRRTT